MGDAPFARSIGFDGQFRVNLPAGEDGVYTISADSMDGDTVTPTRDRTVHLDRYTGKVLADVGFEDYSLAAKAMAVGIALHQDGMAGPSKRYVQCDPSAPPGDEPGRSR